MKININDKVKVKLTERGLDVLENYCSRSFYPNETRKLFYTDADQYHHIALHLLFSAFSETLWHINVPVFENSEIIIDE